MKSNHWVSQNSYRDNSASDEHCCECGCVFEVIVLEQEGHNEMEEYYCPDCHKEYKVRASFTPQVFKKAK